MATPPDAVRTQLAAVTAAATAEMAAEAATAPLEQQATVMLATSRLVVPAFFDAAGSLAVAWYDEIREESRPTTAYVPRITSAPATDWIEREAEKYRRELDTGDLEREMAAMMDEIARLAEKEVARGFRDSITGNVRNDEDAIGWSRVTRGDGCRFCLMLADKGAVFRSESTAIFAAHTNCNCAARPEFEGGDHGPEASVEQYLAASGSRTPAQRAALREYLNEHYPDAPG